MAPRISDEAKEERRITILQAALECFSAKGYYASTVDDIVRYSKLSKGSIYNYFSGKEDIIISILQHETRKSREALVAELKQITSPLEQLKYWINSDIPYNLNKKKLMRVHIEFWLYSTDSPDVQHILSDRFDVTFEMIKEIIAAGKNAGEFRQDIDPEKASAVFWELHDGIWLHATIGYNEDKMAERIKGMEATMLAYLT
ncbi:AcrR family transcriptional regulator [Virgibacillus halotolerans]|uniref:TetR/AcrR family transcriptional regulator n=1 Tax=Virgibacillus halotolerans TaxID=1071053 RepID=UPI00196160BA|nr:TetR/AcrR family transcriptional regulator [Virgibacillus halotolerans]MBM7599745.1 AcrR family transcriptional regulator [Virgibacillus halotolerans]